jgi:hypothetical protein
LHDAAPEFNFQRSRKVFSIKNVIHKVNGGTICCGKLAALLKLFTPKTPRSFQRRPDARYWLGNVKGQRYAPGDGSFVF